MNELAEQYELFVRKVLPQDMSSDTAICSEEFCSNSDTFLCKKHCHRYICFHHLQEHYRLYEKQADQNILSIQHTIRQRLLIYNRLIDLEKLDKQEKQDIENACQEIRRNYQRRKEDYRRIQQEGALSMDSNVMLNDLESFFERLNEAIMSEQQRERIYSHDNAPLNTNIKTEPNDFEDHPLVINSSSLNNQSMKFISDQIEGDLFSSTPLQSSRLTSNSNRQTRSSNEYLTEHCKTSESDADFNETSSNPAQSETPFTSKKLQPRSSNQCPTIYRGTCPLVRSGLFGIVPNHGIRICSGKYTCLYSHLQSYHHMTSTSAHKICHAVVKECDPTTTILFNANDILQNKNFYIKCPFNQSGRNPFGCQPKFIKKAPCSSCISRSDMPRHLRDVHHIHRVAALQIVAEMRRCSKINVDAALTFLNRNIFGPSESITKTIELRKAS